MGIKVLLCFFFFTVSGLPYKRHLNTNRWAGLEIVRKKKKTERQPFYEVCTLK